MTRKEFVLDTVSQLKENPRAVLAGHGIQPAVLQTIVARPDVMSKLATILYSTVYAKKGAPGLKKAANFKITGYQNFPTLNMKAREDVEIFIGGLSAEDSAKFTNADNIITLLILPEGKPTGEETEIEEIISGKSVALTFDTAVRKEYKISGGMYLTVMIGDSAARPAEEAVAARNEKKNKVKNARRTPAKIQAELKAKARKKLDALKAKRVGLEDAAYNTEKELEQYAAIGKEFGTNNTSPIAVAGTMNKFDAAAGAIKEKINALDTESKKTLKMAQKYWNTPGKRALANALFKEIGDEEITAFIKAGSAGSSNEVVNARKKEMQGKLAELVARNEQLLTDLGTAPDERKNSIRSMISKNSAQVREIRAKIGTYKNISVTGMKKKAAMLKETHAAIEANIAAGKSIEQSLNAALAKLAGSPAQKQIIKQQVMQQVGDGMPMQYAVQQAIQENMQEIPVEEFDSTLDGNSTIADIIAAL